jgi:hypothetical protein
MLGLLQVNVGESLHANHNKQNRRYQDEKLLLLPLLLFIRHSTMVNTSPGVALTRRPIRKGRAALLDPAVTYSLYSTASTISSGMSRV